MTPCHRIVLVFCLLACVPMSAQAFDCTPIDVMSNDSTAYFNTVGTGSFPGEPLCGKDYTGWEFHVYEFTIGADALQGIQVSTADAGGGTDLIVLDQCNPNECLLVAENSSTGNVIIQEGVCLAAGTYTAIVATQAPIGTVFNIGTISSDTCTPISDEMTSWGAIKSRF